LTPQHHIIKETSDTLARFFQNEFKRAGYKRVHIIGEAPKPEAIEGKLPAVSVYLYQVAIDHDGIDQNWHTETVVKKNADGSIEEFERRHRLWVRLEYLISSWAQTPEDEQLLLGLAIRAVIDNPALAGEELRGDSFEDDASLSLSLSSRLDEGTLARFWGSLNQPVRPAVQAWTVIPIVPEKLEPLRRVKERRLDYRNINEPQAPGEQGPTREEWARRTFAGD
jgi:hypothetical protein